MKIDNLFWMAMTLTMSGILHVFDIIGHEKGSKTYCQGEECFYRGIILIIIGIFILAYKYKNQKSQ